MLRSIIHREFLDTDEKGVPRDDPPAASRGGVLWYPSDNESTGRVV